MSITVCASTSALARGDGDIWVIVVGQMCLAQNSGYQNTLLGKSLARNGYEEFIEYPVSKCFKKHHWASNELCDEVMNLDEQGLSDVQPIYKRHEKEIRGMAKAFDYVNDQFNKNPPPSCPWSWGFW